MRWLCPHSSLPIVACFMDIFTSRKLSLLIKTGQHIFTEESAEAEPAWEGAGQEPGLKIWRIVVSFYVQATYNILILYDPQIVFCFGTMC